MALLPMNGLIGRSQLVFVSAVLTVFFFFFVSLSQCVFLSAVFTGYFFISRSLCLEQLDWIFPKQ